MQEVCNLSTGVYNKGKMEQARDTTYELHDMGMSSERIARAVKVSIDTVNEWLAEREEMLV